MTQINHPLEVTADALEEKPLGPPSAEVIGDAPVVVRSRVDYKTDDGVVVSGIWECEPGASRWEFVTRSEIIHVVAGAMAVQEDGGELEQITAGSTAYFPLGWKGVWTVTERLRKVFVVIKS